jgi:surface polysaccharide O-acyltransferase-like enzyme
VKKHIDAFDWLRFFAMGAVVFMHVAADPLRKPVGLGWLLLNPFVSLAFTAVPLFFMMSGYLLMTSTKTAELKTLKDRLPRLIVPLVFWSAVASLWETIRDGHDLLWLGKRLISMISSPVMVHFWFMYTLIAMYLISPFLYRCFHELSDSGRKWLAFLLGVIILQSMITLALPSKIATYASIRSFEELRLFSGHLCSFLMGWLLGTTSKRIPNLWLITFALVDWAAHNTYGTWYLTTSSGAYKCPDSRSQAGGYDLLLAACIFLSGQAELSRQPQDNKSLWHR